MMADWAIDLELIKITDPDTGKPTSGEGWEVYDAVATQRFEDQKVAKLIFDELSKHLEHLRSFLNAVEKKQQGEE